MSVKVFNTRIQLKHDVNTGGNGWASDTGKALVLLPGEFAWDSTNNNFKVGDGTTTWSQLPYAIGASKLNGYSTSSVTGNVQDGDTLLQALAKIEVKADQGGVTSFGGKTGAITLGNYLTMGTGNDSNQVNVNHVDTAGTSTTDTDLATIKTVDTKIGALNVSSFKQASITGSSSSSTLTINGISETTGKIATDSTTNKVDILIDGVYNDSTNKIATQSTVTTAVTNAINALDVPSSGDGAITGFDAGKTLATLTETDGKIAATFQNISITSSQVSDVQHTYSSSDEKAISGKGVAAAIGTLDTQSDVVVGSLNGSTLTINGVKEIDGIISASTNPQVTLEFKTAPTTGDNANKILTEADISGIVGAMVYQGAVDSQHALPDSPSKGDVYMVGEAGTYADKACEVGDMLVYNGTSWDAINGENQVTNAGATITAGAGSATNIATVDGTAITAQVSVTAGTATIASESNGVVTLKAGIAQTGTTGTIANNSNSDITLAKVATTGTAADVAIVDSNNKFTAENVEAALTELKNDIAALDSVVDADQTATETGKVVPTLETPSDDFKVLNAVTEVDGKLTAATAYNVKKLAATANTDDLTQGMTFLFDCGSATTVVDQQ